LGQVAYGLPGNGTEGCGAWFNYGVQARCVQMEGCKLVQTAEVTTYDSSAGVSTSNVSNMHWQKSHIEYSYQLCDPEATCKSASAVGYTPKGCTQDCPQLHSYRTVCGVDGTTTHGFVSHDCSGREYKDYEFPIKKTFPGSEVETSTEEEGDIMKTTQTVESFVTAPTCTRVNTTISFQLRLKNVGYSGRLDQAFADELKMAVAHAVAKGAAVGASVDDVSVLNFATASSWRM